MLAAGPPGEEKYEVNGPEEETDLWIGAGF